MICRSCSLSCRLDAARHDRLTRTYLVARGVSGSLVRQLMADCAVFISRGSTTLASGTVDLSNAFPDCGDYVPVPDSP